MRQESLADYIHGHYGEEVYPHSRKTTSETRMLFMYFDIFQELGMQWNWP